MNELISINEQDVNGLIDTVNGRELHDFMEVGKRFTTWIQDRIKSYGFIEGQDYVVTEVSPSFGNNNSGGRPSKEYYLTLDTAKEIAMVERNEKGREARRYFIQCEKQLREQKSETLIPTQYDKIAAAHRMLGITGSTQLQLVRSYAEKHDPETLAALPYYGVDTQQDIPQGSTERVASATDLLKDHDLHDMFKSARSFNIAAIKAGLIEERDRRTTAGKQQPIKWLTKKGLKYGVNRMDERNKNQIHWYDATFSEAVDIAYSAR